MIHAALSSDDPAAGRAGSSSDAAAARQADEPLRRLARVARGLAADYALLAVLDLRRAAIQLGWLVALGVVVAVLVVAAWLTGVAALMGWAVNEGTTWPVVLGWAAVVNIVVAGALVLWARSRFAELPFAATLRQLRAQLPEE